MTLKRIIMHWSAGAHSVSALDRQHYHYIVSGTGEAIAGIHRPESNIFPKKGAYAAHILSLNTGSIGVALAAMAGAVERPFNAGKAPITPVQLDKFIHLVAALSCKYGIPVTRETVLSHAEVQPTLKVKQRGKWDICWIPGMFAPGDPVAVGDELRRRITAAKAV
ncbi:N-acetylmuramoyl-L-alanine amidase [Paracoccus sp. SSK6]|uniref:peptidoglycan recognition protein family protein n=1 Tax=Paracoccus sp. SSK6 TaxID=3143131 RepID=UPI00321917F3